MRKRVLLLLSVVFSIYSLPARAGYLILKETPCEKSSFCLEPLPSGDPHEAELYQILLENSWPTAQLHRTHLYENEADNLGAAVSKSSHLKGKYRFVWIPDVIEDLSCAAFILKQTDWARFVEFQIGDVYSQILSATNEKKVKEVEAFLTGLNLRHQQAFFLCHRETVGFLLDYVHKKLTAPEDIQILFTDSDQRRKIVADLIARYEKSAYGKNIVQISKVHQPLIQKVIELEWETHLKNEALLFRGSSGVSLMNGDLIIDGFCNRGMEAKSFGVSLFAGVIHDSTVAGEKTACSMNYFQNLEVGYVVKLKKSDFYKKGDHSTLFDVPPLGLIGRLNGKGENFHPHSKVGTRSQDREAIVGGFEGDDAVQSSVEAFSRLGIIIDESEFGFDLGLKLDRYIADHSVVLCRGGKCSGSFSSSDPVILAQKKFADRCQVAAHDPNSFKNADSLIRLLAIPAWTERRPHSLESARVLGSRLDPLTEPEQEVRKAVLKALGTMKVYEDPEVSVIAHSLQDPNAEVRLAAAEVLLSIPREKIKAEILDVVSSHINPHAEQSPEVRRAALRILGAVKVQKSQILDGMLEALSDSAPMVRQAAAQASALLSLEGTHLKDYRLGIVHLLTDLSHGVRQTARRLVLECMRAIESKEGHLETKKHRPEDEVFYTALVDLLKSQMREVRCTGSEVLSEGAKFFSKQIELKDWIEKNPCSKSPIQDTRIKELLWLLGMA